MVKLWKIQESLTHISFFCKYCRDKPTIFFINSFKNQTPENILILEPSNRIDILDSCLRTVASFNSKSGNFFWYYQIAAVVPHSAACFPI